MCCNEATRKRIEVNEMRMLWWSNDTQIQDQERKQREGRRLPKRSRETIEMVRPCDEGRRRTHTEESVALLADLEFHGKGSYTICFLLTYRYDCSIIYASQNAPTGTGTSNPTCIAHYN